MKWEVTEVQADGSVHPTILTADKVIISDSGVLMFFDEIEDHRSQLVSAYAMAGWRTCELVE